MSPAHTTSPQAAPPEPGELWVLADVPGGHGVYHADGAWKILVRTVAGEYTLAPAYDVTPLELSLVQPAGPHWADEFDALARAQDLEITWDEEIRSYQQDALRLLGSR